MEYPKGKEGLIPGKMGGEFPIKYGLKISPKINPKISPKGKMILKEFLEREGIQININ